MTKSMKKVNYEDTISIVDYDMSKKLQTLLTNCKIRINNIRGFSPFKLIGALTLSCRLQEYYNSTVRNAAIKYGKYNESELSEIPNVKDTNGVCFDDTYYWRDDIDKPEYKKYQEISYQQFLKMCFETLKLNDDTGLQENTETKNE